MRAVSLFVFHFGGAWFFPCSSCFWGIDNGADEAYNVVERGRVWCNLLEEPEIDVSLAILSLPADTVCPLHWW